MSRVHPSQERRLPWHFMGLAGAETGCATFLLPAPCCGRSEGCCWGRAGAKVGAAGGRPRRRAGGGACNRRRGDDSSGLPGQNVSARFVRWRTAGKALHRVAGEACLGDRGVQEAVLVGLTHICQVPKWQGPSLCAVPASNLGQNCPRSAAGRFAGGPWRAGQRRPVQQLCKPRR